MRINTDRLILRPWEENDAKSLFEYAKNPNVGPIAGWPVHTSIENSLEVIRNVLSAKETYAVCLKEDNIAIGSIGLISPAQAHTKTKEDEMEVGYWIGEPFWGNGYIPEAVRAIQKHAFEDLNCSALWCGYYEGNEKSKKVQLKCGFTYHHVEKDKLCVLMGDSRTEWFTRIEREEWIKANGKTAVIYIHGKGGTADESKHYEALFPDSVVIGFDYKSNTPWEAKSEFYSKFVELSKEYEKITVIANSIGAFFLMNSGVEPFVNKAYLISPIVDMEKLIGNMMIWANVTEDELKEKGVISIDFGENLSWEYLEYVRNNPICWSVPTKVLYGEKDSFTTLETMQAFVKRIQASITVMMDGEHWFHTKEQMDFLDTWIKTSVQINA